MRPILLTALALTLLACDPTSRGSLSGCDEAKTVTDDTDTTDNNDPPIATASLSLAFVSGHLGNTWDCPGEGVSLGPSAAKADAASPGQGAGAPHEDCGEDCEGISLNCESGSLMLQVTNTGEVTLTGFEVTDLELLDLNGELLAALDAIKVSVIMSGATLAPGETAQLRITLTAPESADLGHNDSALLRAIVVTPEDAAAELTTPEVSGLGLIAT